MSDKPEKGLTEHPIYLKIESRQILGEEDAFGLEMRRRISRLLEDAEAAAKLLLMQSSGGETELTIEVGEHRGASLSVKAARDGSIRFDFLITFQEIIANRSDHSMPS